MDSYIVRYEIEFKADNPGAAIRGFFEHLCSGGEPKGQDWEVVGEKGFEVEHTETHVKIKEVDSPDPWGE
jgi:hypothetical protein